MITRIEHLGIAVADATAATETFARLLGNAAYKTEVVESEGVKTVFFRLGESKIELLEATTANSPIAKYLEKRGPGIHHIAFYSDDIVADLARLQSEGFQLIHTQPKPGADGMQIAFLHPKSTQGVLIELCQEATPR